MTQREGYYDYMLRRSREEDAKLNSPINDLQQLMTITMEECGELTQQCSKIMRKYKTKDQIEEDQQTLLVEELGDLQCMINLMIKHKIVTWDQIQARAKVKNEKLKKWSTLVESN